IDGLGDDWPISYEDLKPYYDRVDRFVGIYGSVENLPNEPDGIFLPPPKPRCYELLVKRSADRLGITCIPSRMSILTRPHNGRPACHYCGQCGRGCGVNANFSSTNVLLPPALATGRLTLITQAMAREVTVNERGPAPGVAADSKPPALATGRLTLITQAMAREVTVNERGLATGVTYIDKRTGEEKHVRARIVVLAASACESARILLNSKSSLFPHGLANSSGVVGK